MKKLGYFLVLITLISACQSETSTTESDHIMAPLEELDEAVDEPQFDSIKALAYGADDYGMKQYVMAFLKKGPNRDRDSLESYKLQRAHLDNIKRMADEGQLVLAGPFLNDGELRGIYIFNVSTIEQAKALTETDPAIQAGSLVMELVPWYGSAALMGVSKEHKLISKKSI